MEVGEGAAEEARIFLKHGYKGVRPACSLFI